jgi:hypothetical protein
VVFIKIDCKKREKNSRYSKILRKTGRTSMSWRKAKVFSIMSKMREEKIFLISILVHRKATMIWRRFWNLYMNISIWLN